VCKNIFENWKIKNLKIRALQILLKSYSYVTYASQQYVWVINFEGKAPSIKLTFCNTFIKVCFNCLESDPYTLIYLYKCGRTLHSHLNNISLIYVILTQLNCWYKFQIIFFCLSTFWDTSSYLDSSDWKRTRHDSAEEKRINKE